MSKVPISVMMIVRVSKMRCPMVVRLSKVPFLVMEIPSHVIRH